MNANRKVLTVFIAALALMMVAPVAVLAQDENTEPEMMSVTFDGMSLTMASTDFVNSYAEDDEVCFAHSDDIFFEDGTTEVSTSGSYNSVRFVNSDGVMVWEILPHGAHLVFDESQPMWISEWSPLCTLEEVVEKVIAQIAPVAAADNTVQIGGLLSYMDSDMFGPIWYGGPFWGGLVDPATDQRCHADPNGGGRIKAVGKTISSPDNWIRVQIWNERLGTQEFDYAVPPGEIVIEEPGTSIRWWSMVNCDELGANRDAAGSPARRRAVALANTGGYVRNWEAHYSAEWFGYTPAN